MGPTAAGAPNKVDIEKSGRELDRRVSAKMFTQPAMNKWGIFHGDRDAQVANQFKSSISQILKQVSFDFAEPAVYAVKPGMKSDAWIKELKKHHHMNYVALCPLHAAMFQPMDLEMMDLIGYFLKN